MLSCGIYTNRSFSCHEQLCCSGHRAEAWRHLLPSRSIELSAAHPKAVNPSGMRQGESCHASLSHAHVHLCEPQTAGRSVCLQHEGTTYRCGCHVRVSVDARDCTDGRSTDATFAAGCCLGVLLALTVRQVAAPASLRSESGSTWAGRISSRAGVHNASMMCTVRKWPCTGHQLSGLVGAQSLSFSAVGSHACSSSRQLPVTINLRILCLPASSGCPESPVM